MITLEFLIQNKGQCTLGVFADCRRCDIQEECNDYIGGVSTNKRYTLALEKYEKLHGHTALLEVLL
jgi:hypothetical protein